MNKEINEYLESLGIPENMRSHYSENISGFLKFLKNSQKSNESSNESGNESSNESGNESSNESGNESSNESGNESSNESGNESSNESGNESSNESGNESSNESGNESSNESGNESSNESGNESSNESGNESSNESGNESSNESGNESSNESGNESSNESGNEHIDPHYDYRVIERIRDQKDQLDIDHTLANQVSNTLNDIQGNEEIVYENMGKFSMSQELKSEIETEINGFSNRKVFEKTDFENGLDVYLLVDCSYSMRYTEGAMTDITATLYKALENTANVNFRVFGYSGDYGKLAIQEINSLYECKHITPDPDLYNTPTHFALHWINEQIVNNQNKKLVIVFTDGMANCLDVNTYDELTTVIRKQVIRFENKGIDYFTILYENSDYYVKIMRKIFLNNFVHCTDFEDVQKQLIGCLTEKVRQINED